jgi:CBS domain-containing protein
MLAKDIMTVDVVFVKPDNTVEDVVKLLLEKKISGVPVVNDDKEVIGIVSEGDLIIRSQKLRSPSYIQFLGGVIYLDDPEEFKEELKKAIAVKVEDVMTKEPITVEEDTQVEEIATIMYDAKINRLPVVKDDKLVGIVSRADIVRSLVKKEQTEGDEQ